MRVVVLGAGNLVRLWWKLPERWWLFGVPLGGRQPPAVLPEGVRVFFY